MQKRSDSLRSKGLTVIAVDKPLRADIKAQAAKHNVTMVDYIRSIVEEDKRGYSQAIMKQVAESMDIDPGSFGGKVTSFFNFMGKLEDRVLNALMKPGELALQYSKPEDMIYEGPVVPPMLKGAIRKAIEEVLEEMKNDPELNPQES